MKSGTKMVARNPRASELIDAYIEKSAPFSRPICRKLREIIRKAEPEMVEDWKWGPNYQRNGMVCGFGAFKEHVTFFFFQGASMKDPEKILTDGSQNAHNRSLKLRNPYDIDEKKLIAYIKEAVSVNEKGSIKKEKTIALPREMRQLLGKHRKAREFFDSLSYTFRKEYVLWMTGAKKKETKAERLRKFIPMLSKSVKEP